ncbi:enolase C-terminal domain-like protein [Lacrimispora sp.]|uniref:enolase C-terminal domain-like protein n=1 Tax=Lacrimispora sp. TaxID=2719234 RepID=UPI003460B35A
MFHIDENQKITFSKAVYYNFNPIKVKKPWRDATGGFGNYAPIQGWIQIFDTEGFYGGTFCSTGIVNNILPLILTGETKTYKEWYDFIYWKMRNFGFQSGQIVDLGQLDLIMLEIMSKRADKPLHRYLGADKDWAAAYKGGGSLLSDDDDLVADMVRYVEEGYRTVKLKVGSDWGKNMERDVRRVEKVRKAVGNHVEIAVDGNQVWNVEQAVGFADMVRPYNIAWYEEPVHSHDMNAIKEVKEKTGMVISYGESMRNYFAFETYAEKGVGHLMPLVGRMSKMSDLMKIRQLTKDKGLRFSSGGTVWINAAFGALYDENELLENHEPMTEPIGDCLKVKPEEKNGRLYLPDIIGCPIRIDLPKLEKEGTLESVKCFYTEKNKNNFAVRAAY